MIVFSDVAPCSLEETGRRFRVLITAIIRVIMEAVSTSETSVNFYRTTRRNIPEDSHFHTRRSMNLKSHVSILCRHYSVYAKITNALMVENVYILATNFQTAYM
jgi:hypothetical protein